MESFFGTNPLSTPIGRKIERATDDKLPEIDWALNMEICDMINNASEDGPRNAMKAIRKRMSNYKASQQIMLALTLLETCVKNCGPRFHLAVSQKEFVTELNKMVQAKGQLPTVIVDRLLGLIQSWADAFQGQSGLNAIVHLRDTLLKHGVEFPAQDFDSMSPIFTPERSVPEPPPEQQTQYMPQQTPFMPQQTPYMPQQTPYMPQQNQYAGQQGAIPQNTGGSTEPINPNPEQLAKIRRELDIVTGNAEVMNEMMTEMSDSHPKEADISLLNDLNTTCREMQTRVMDLICRIANEELTSVLLKINDDLNNAFVRYDRFQRQQATVANLQEPQQPVSQQLEPVPSATNVPAAAQPQTDLLIDFGDTGTATTAATADANNPTFSNVSSQLSSLSLTSAGPNQPTPVLPGQPQLAPISADLPSYNTAVSNPATPTNISSLPPINPIQPLVNPQVNQQDRSQALASFANTTPSTDPSYGYMSEMSSQPMSDSLAFAMNTKNPNVDNTPKRVTNPGLTTSSQLPTELDEWLKATNEHNNPPPNPSSTATTQASQPVSSSEFDKFLASRVASVRQQPAAGEPTATGTNPTSNSPPKPKRQMQMAEADSGLFGL